MESKNTTGANETLIFLLLFLSLFIYCPVDQWRLPLCWFSFFCIKAVFIYPHAFVISQAAVSSTSPPPSRSLLSFSFLIRPRSVRRLSSQFWSFLAFIWVWGEKLFSYLLLHKFVIFFSQFVDTFYHSASVIFFFFFFLSPYNQLNNFKWIKFFFFLFSPSIYLKAPGWWWWQRQQWRLWWGWWWVFLV